MEDHYPRMLYRESEKGAEPMVEIGDRKLDHCIVGSAEEEAEKAAEGWAPLNPATEQPAPKADKGEVKKLREQLAAETKRADDAERRIAELEEALTAPDEAKQAA